jgi:hypothetical protein
LARIATGDEVGDQALWRAINQLRAIGPADLATCGQHKGMPRRDIPIMRWRQTRVEVGASFGDPAKFD